MLTHVTECSYYYRSLDMCLIGHVIDEYIESILNGWDFTCVFFLLCFFLAFFQRKKIDCYCVCMSMCFALYTIVSIIWSTLSDKFQAAVIFKDLDRTTSINETEKCCVSIYSYCARFRCLIHNSITKNIF